MAVVHQIEDEREDFEDESRWQGVKKGKTLKPFSPVKGETGESG